LLVSGSSMRRGAIGYFRLALGRFKWNQTYRIVTAPRRTAGLRCEGDRQTYRLDCADDAVLDRGRPTTNCYPLPPGSGNVQGGVHEATLAYQTAPGTLNWTESGTNGSNGCVYQGSGQLAIGRSRRTPGPSRLRRSGRGWRSSSARSAEAVRD
jgi:hypothetical protein